ncbi:MAG: hypothetical protein IT445_06495 [Phycisphaeraceae bacterium]|nr:hypothetical protein [Phycisphaeraceae bacterium]
MLQGMLRMSICAGLALGGATLAMADQTADLQARVSQLESQLAQVQKTQSDNWMTERRAEEIKGLISEVLSDADTRASLLQDGLTAGHDGKNFFLKSNDGGFVLKIAGQIDIRALWDMQDDRSDSVVQDLNGDGDTEDTVDGVDEDDVSVEDDSDFGFQTRRVKLIFFGNVPGSQIDYKVQLATDRSDGNIYLEDVIIGRAINDNFYISGGKQKLPFLREELTSSAKLIAIDRGLVTEYFTLNRAEGAQLDWSNNDNLKASVAISDGSNTEISDMGADDTDFAVTARADFKVMGDWEAAKDDVAWQGQDNALFIGGAVHYQAGDDNNADITSAVADYFAWTVDALYENGGGLSASAAVVGGHTDYDSSAAADRDMYGIQLTGAYNIDDKWQPYVRWEWIDQDVALAGIEDNIQAVTFGVNRFVRGHNVKLTADVVWVYQGDVISNPFGASVTSTGLGTSGFSSAEDEDIIMVRAQVQVLF